MPSRMEMLAQLLAQKYPNAGIDVNQPVIRPTPIPNTPWTGTPWGTPPAGIPAAGDPTLLEGDGGRGGPAGSSATPEGWGKMDPTTRGAFGVAGTLAGLLGGGPLGWGLGAMGLASDKLAGPYETNPYSGLRAVDELGIRDIQDYEGMFAAQAARDALSQRNADIAANKSAITDPAAGFRGISEGRKDADAPDTESPSFGGYGRGDPSYGDAPGMGGSDPGGGGNTGGATAGDNPGGPGADDGSGQSLRRGGVLRASGRKSQQLTWGEPGTKGETAIFVPELMKKAGIQGREQEVIQALRTMLRFLEDSQSAQRTPAKTPGTKKEAA